MIHRCNFYRSFLLWLALMAFPASVFAANNEIKPIPSPGTSANGVSGVSTSAQVPSTFPPPATTPKLDCLIEPNQMVDLATSVSGIVKVVNVDRGHIIKTGQVLAQLEAEVEKANVAHSRARVEFASKKYRRMQELYKEQMVSAQQMEEAKTENDLAVAELRKATEMLNQRTVFSPFHGVVVERYVSPGELVDSKKVIKVAQINPLRVEVIAPISMLGEFKIDAKMQVIPEGPVAGPFEASVQLVDRVVDAPSGTFRVRLALPNPKHQISAGVRCKAQLIQPKPKAPKAIVPKAKVTDGQATTDKTSKPADAPKPKPATSATPKNVAPSTPAPKTEVSIGDAVEEKETHNPGTADSDTSQTGVPTGNVPKENAGAQTTEQPKSSAPGAKAPQAGPPEVKASEGEVQPKSEIREQIPSGYHPDE